MSVEPIIYSKNYITADGVFLCSHGSTLIERIYDRDKNSLYITSGANSDATEAYVEIAFYEGTVAQTRTIDTIILVNHNLKAPAFQYWDGSAWQDLVSGSNLAVSTSIFTFTAQATTKLKIKCSTTQTANQEKQFGELIACLKTLTLARDLESYDVTFRQKAVEIPLADGSIHRSVVAHSDNRSQKYEAKFTLNFLTTAQLEVLQAIKEAGAAFLVQPESIARPDEIYLVNWTNPFNYKYVSIYKGGGHRLEIQVKEV